MSVAETEPMVNTSGGPRMTGFTASAVVPLAMEMESAWLAVPGGLPA